MYGGIRKSEWIAVIKSIGCRCPACCILGAVHVVVWPLLNNPVVFTRSGLPNFTIASAVVQRTRCHASASDHYRGESSSSAGPGGGQSTGACPTVCGGMCGNHHPPLSLGRENRIAVVDRINSNSAGRSDTHCANRECAAARTRVLLTQRGVERCASGARIAQAFRAHGLDPERDLGSDLLSARSYSRISRCNPKSRGA